MGTKCNTIDIFIKKKNQPKKSKLEIFLRFKMRNVEINIVIINTIIVM